MVVQERLPRLLRSAYFALHRQTDAALAKLGVTADQFVLLATLHPNHVMTQRELADRMPSDPSTVRAMLVLLEEHGLVSRAANPNDSRAKAVSLTAKGKRTFQKLWNAGEQIRARMVAHLSPQEGQTLVQLLSSVAESLDDPSSKLRKAKSHGCPVP